MATTDYAKLANELQGIDADLGASRKIIAAFNDSGTAGKKLTDALAEVDKLAKRLASKLAQTPVTEDERKRKIAELKSDIGALEIRRESEPDFEARIVLGHTIARLSVTIAEYQAQALFNFEALLNPDKIKLKDLLTAAAADLQAKQNLARVLSGIQVAMEVAAFSAGVAAKLAASAVG